MNELELRELVYRDVVSWYEKVKDAPLSFKVIAQRFNKRAKKVGVGLSDLVAGDPRLVLKTKVKTGARLVYLAEEIDESRSKIMAMIGIV